MKRTLPVLVLVFVVAALATGAGYFVLNASNKPARTVTAADLEPESRVMQPRANTPLETFDRPEPPPPEPKPVPEQPKIEAPKPVLPEARQEDISHELGKVMADPDLTDEQKKVRIQELAKALAEKSDQFKVTLKGRVLDHAGTPLASATVLVNSANADSAQRRRPAIGMRVIATSDAEGNFEGVYSSAGDAAFEIELFARSSITPQSEYQKLTVTPGETYDGLVITMPQGAAITGRVVDDNFNPISGARVIAVVKGGLIRGGGHSAYSDKDGRFTLAGLETATYLVSASAAGYGADDPTEGVVALSVTRGEPTAMASDLMLKIETGLKIRLICAARQPKGMFTANFYKADNVLVRGSGFADSEGNAIIAGVPDDAIEMIITMRGFVDTPRLPVSIVIGTHTDVGEITLEAVPETKRVPKHDSNDDSDK